MFDRVAWVIIIITVVLLLILAFVSPLHNPQVPSDNE